MSLINKKKNYVYKCFVNTCNNVYYRTRIENKVSFFRIPGDKRQDDWLRAIGRSDLINSGNNKTALRGKRICSEHFNNLSFYNPISKRSLRSDAVPSINLPSIDVTAEKHFTTYPTPRERAEKMLLDKSGNLRDQFFLIPPSSSKYFGEINNPEIIKLKNEILTKNKQIHHLKQKVEKLQETNRMLRYRHEKISRVNRNRNSEKELSGSVKTFFDMQIKNGSNKSYSEEERKFAIRIYSRSPALYNQLRNREGFVLPHKNTISRWINSVNLEAGFIKNVFDFLGTKFDGCSEEERSCVLLFDEISIKRSKSYKSKFDYIEGVADYSKFGRQLTTANYILVFT